MGRARARASATVSVYVVSAPAPEQSPGLGMKLLDQVACLCPVLLYSESKCENLWFPRERCQSVTQWWVQAGFAAASRGVEYKRKGK